MQETTMHQPLRRRERGLTIEKARRVIEESDFGVMSTVDAQGVPYGVPIHFALEGNKLYFHGTVSEDSRRALNLQVNDRVSICFVRHCRVVQDELSTDYASAIVSGRVCLAEGEDKARCINALIRRFAPDNSPERNARELTENMHITKWWMVEIESVTGKCRGKF